ncbi:DUF1837 domain-containing protein [Salmonella enterica subsp. enterica]|nr:DUF1837 domain-containing protein [Salmonella enterica subsp. enterica]EDW9585767.1 DUF1837 domain-containing protein [Salmonella enterica subsp. enterica]EED9672582.1 DUF1837 domain-containing protein [Salmonella enterica subsp. enterica]
MIKKLTPQLKNHDEIRSILREKDVTIFLEDGRKVDTFLIYLPIVHGKSDHLRLFEVIKREILYNFAFKCCEINRKLKSQSPSAIDELINKAIRRLSQHTAHGELGELILFTLLDVYLEAPKILSKISLKTSRRMPVYGADAVHAQYYNNEIRLYFGESKLHKNFDGAASDAAKSIKSAKDKYQVEFDLIESHLDFPNMDDELQEDIMDLINPFSEKDYSQNIHSPCFIGFTGHDIISSSKNNDEFLEKYILLAKNHTNYFFKKIEEQTLEHNKSTLMLLPFSDIDELVKEFIDYLGIEK